MEKENQEKIQEVKAKEEKEKTMKELSGRKRSLSERKAAILDEETEHEAELRGAENLFNESNERLKAAIKGKNFQEVSIVQNLLDVSTKKMETARKKLKNAEKRKNPLA